MNAESKAAPRMKADSAEYSQKRIFQKPLV